MKSGRASTINERCHTGLRFLLRAVIKRTAFVKIRVLYAEGVT
ncbi:MAG: hypothetical protein ABR501_12455 [Pyrinomonadaceae bacterium]